MLPGHFLINEVLKSLPSDRTSPLSLGTETLETFTSLILSSVSPVEASLERGDAEEARQCRDSPLPGMSTRVSPLLGCGSLGWERRLLSSPACVSVDAHCCLWDRHVVDTANSPLPPSSPLFFSPSLLSFLLGAPLALGTEPKCFKRWLIFKGTESGIAQVMAGCSTDQPTHLLLFFPKPAGSSQETVTTQPHQTRRPPHPRSNCETLLQPPEAINSLFKKPLWGLSRPDGRSLFAAPSNKWRKKF